MLDGDVIAGPHFSAFDNDRHHAGLADQRSVGGAAAAGTYVPLDRLRAIGLSVRYDPVYDELDLSA